MTRADTASTVHCALVAVAGWRKSSRSQAENDCVALAGAGGWVGVRDTKLGDGSPVLTVPTAHFAAFVAELPRR